MIAKTKKHVANAVAAGLAAAALYAATPAAAFPTGMYDLYNQHEEESYGLRLDVICYWVSCGSTWTIDEKTFSVESPTTGESTVWLDWGLGGTDYTKAQITGTVYYNDGDGPWTITYDFENIQAISGGDPTTTDPNGAVNGWYVDDSDGYGTLVRQSDGLTIHLRGTSNFVFDDDTGTLTGTGWLEARKEGTYYWKDYDKNKWRVVAEPKDQPPPPGVPEPGTLALFGLGLIGLGYARRRRSAA